MVRAVAPYRSLARNEDLAIVTFNPLPGNEMQFGAVRAVLRDFLCFERPTDFLDIQPTHLGQALVKFVHAYSRDVLVAESPHVFGDVTVSFSKHNEGRNWRRAEFDHECWLLLLGLPNDYWTERHIHSALGEFARVLLFEAEERHCCRLIIRARVTDLEKVPQFIVYSDPDVVDGDSCTLQCEVLQQHPQQQDLGPPPEDPVPDEMEIEPVIPFDFFGLGQPANENGDQAQVNDQNEEGNQIEQIGQDEMQQQQVNAWDP